jgi:hypothetical protein
MTSEERARGSAMGPRLAWPSAIPVASPVSSSSQMPVILRASVGSTEASNGNLARVGVVGLKRARGKKGDSLGRDALVSRWPPRGGRLRFLGAGLTR